MSVARGKHEEEAAYQPTEKLMDGDDASADNIVWAVHLKEEAANARSSAKREERPKDNQLQCGLCLFSL